MSHQGSFHRMQLGCAMLSDYWDVPLMHTATNPTSLGVWVDTELPLEPGEEVVVALTPPESADTLVTRATVVRARLVRRRTDAGSSGMRLHFTGLSAAEQRSWSRCLRGCSIRPNAAVRSNAAARSNAAEVGFA